MCHFLFFDFGTFTPLYVSLFFYYCGTPDGYRHMNGYGSQTFKLVNKNNEAVYCKFHCKVSTVAPLYVSLFVSVSSKTLDARRCAVGQAPFYVCFSVEFSV